MSSPTTTLKGELWGLATYFNPVGYRNKYRHLKLFAREARRQGLKLAIVEMAFDDSPLVLTPDVADIVLQVRSSTILWQKERLLNIALKHLPETCDKIAWLDADILFGNESWVEDTCRSLERFPVVQLFDVAWWLPPGVTTPSQDLTAEGFIALMHGLAFTQTRGPSLGLPFGYCGFAWAARRTLLETHGFYDRLILGGGDMAMASGMYRTLFNPPIAVQQEELFRRFSSPAQYRDLVNWKDHFYEDVKENVGYVTGPVFHLWHGTYENRDYVKRSEILRKAKFDPNTDLAIDSGGCWKWSSDKPDLHIKVKEYFWNRKEDTSLFEHTPVTAEE